MRYLLLLLGLLFLSCAQPQEPTLDVAPTARTLVAGQGVQLTVTRRFSGGAVEDVTTKVAYTTSDKLLATVDKGIVVAGEGNGSVIIRVFDPTSDASGAATFTIVPAAITSIDLSPPAAAIKKGQKRQFSAIGHFNNGTTSDITTSVLWSATNELAATVDKGLVTSVASGNTDILATDAQTGVQGRAQVFVTGDDSAPQLKALVVTPNPATIANGGKLQFQALGVMSDGSTQDKTQEVTWKSSITTVATIDPAGMLTAVAAGDTTVTASDQTNTVKGSAAAKVTP
jgi:hypothetical protein